MTEGKMIDIDPKTMAELVRKKVPLTNVRGSSELPVGQGKAQISKEDVANIARENLLPEGTEIRGN